MSLPLMTYALIVSILVLITNIPFIEMPWVPWLSPKLTKELAVFNTFIIGIGLTLFPVTYEPKVRPRLMYVLLTVFLVSGSFWRVSYQKAPSLNGVITLCSFISLVMVRWYVKPKKKTN
jgi:hypothetical protein